MFIKLTFAAKSKLEGKQCLINVTRISSAHQNDGYTEVMFQRTDDSSATYHVKEDLATVESLIQYALEE